MGPVNNIFSLVIGLNLVLVGAVAVLAGVVSLVKKNESVKKTTSIVYLLAGVAAVSIGVVLTKSSINM